MKSIHFFCLILLLMAQACKQGAQVEEEQTAEQQNAASSTDTSGAQGGHDFTFLTDQLFHYETVNIIGQDAGDNPYKDQWIDLLPDGTYKAGLLKEQTHTGTWGYDHEIKTLNLQPDDASFKKSEWKVMHSNNIMVWVGTQTYGNNATQIRLIRSTELP